MDHASILNLLWILTNIPVNEPEITYNFSARHLHFDVRKLWSKCRKKQSRNLLACHLVVRTAVHTV